MFLIPEVRFLGLSLLLLPLIGGCVRKYQVTPEPLSQREIVQDEAMQQRDWPQATSVYQTGATPAFSTGFRYGPSTVYEGWEHQLISPTLFVGQTIILPYVLVKDNATRFVSYRKASLEPTHTAMPPLSDPQQ